jgi:tetratricopeptide (TPR) repeat protein/transcriptional regulator with XRE-family HTH domain
MHDRVSGLGGRLRQFRLRGAMTQEELAFKAGLGVRTIRDIETGRTRPQPHTLRLLVAALGIDEADRRSLTETPDQLDPAPRELPRVPAVFAGRESQLASITTAVDHGTGLVVLHGMAGIGKTTLALRAAHDLSSRFPDGHLFMNLQGFTQSAGPRPTVTSLLTRALLSLGLTQQEAPVDTDELVVRYRSVLADRRVLLVLDDAANAEQVEALMPGSLGSLVIATSRHDLSVLADAHHVPLDPPPMREAAAMVRAACDRITEQEGAAIAARCERLPLAMGLAAARLRSCPHWSVEDLLGRFADEGRLLDEVDMGHAGVAEALHASYRELDDAQQRLLRRLGLVPGDDVDVHAAAALCGVPEDRAFALLESLVDVHLLETRKHGRYRLHSMVRLFAARTARAEEPKADLDEAFLRLLDLYAQFSCEAAVLADTQHPRSTEASSPHEYGAPDFTDQASAISWFQDERSNLAAAVFEAERAGARESAWRLANAFGAFRLHDADIEQQFSVNGAALDIARRLDDDRKIARSLGYRGRHFGYAGRRREAISSFEEAAALKRKLGDDAGAAMEFRNIGILHRQSGRFAEALDVYRTALALAETASDAKAAVYTGVNMVEPLLRLRRLDDAEQYLSDAEARLDAADAYNRARIDNYRGTVARERGNPADALSAHTACFEQCERLGMRDGIVPILIEIGEDLLRLGRHTEAVNRLREAVEQSEAQSYRSLECSARNVLGRALAASGDIEEAIEQYARASELAESDGEAFELARAHHGLADACRRNGDMDASLHHLRAAARGYTSCGVPEAAVVAHEMEGL